MFLEAGRDVAKDFLRMDLTPSPQRLRFVMYSAIEALCSTLLHMNFRNAVKELTQAK